MGRGLGNSVEPARAQEISGEWGGVGVGLDAAAKHMRIRWMEVVKQ